FGLVEGGEFLFPLGELVGFGPGFVEADEALDAVALVFCFCFLVLFHAGLAALKNGFGFDELRLARGGRQSRVSESEYAQRATQTTLQLHLSPCGIFCVSLTDGNRFAQELFSLDGPLVRGASGGALSPCPVGIQASRSEER